MVERDLQRGISAHRQADEVRLVDRKMIEHGDRIAHHVLVAVGGRIGWHVGRHIAARRIGDAAVALAELAHLRLPAAIVGGEFVHEQDRHALPGFLVVELHIVATDRVRHGRHPFSRSGTLYGS
jgi:hypothetical protein